VSDSEIDRRLMQAALRLGRRNEGQAWPNPFVGALIVQWSEGSPKIVGRGWTASGGRPHAETVALAEAGDLARGADCYVTLEPCSHTGKTPPCADALIAAGIRRCVVATTDPNPKVAGEGVAKLRKAGIEVETGCLEARAREDHRGHFTRITRGRPATLLKLAVSADGYAGRTDRGNVAITGEEARARTHRMRSLNDAILVGIGTVLADDPALTCRLPGLEDRSPVRVVADSRLRLPPDSRLARTARDVPVWVLTGPDADAGAAERLAALGVEILPVAAGADGRVDPEAGLRMLAGKGITLAMVEGGPALAEALLKRDLVDRAAIYRSSVEIGETFGLPAFPGSSLDEVLADARFDRLEDEAMGADRLHRLKRKD